MTNHGPPHLASMQAMYILEGSSLWVLWVLTNITLAKKISIKKWILGLDLVQQYYYGSEGLEF